MVFESGKLNVVAGAGRFVRMPLFPPLFEGHARRDASWLAENFPYGETPVRRAATDAPDKDEL